MAVRRHITLAAAAVLALVISACEPTASPGGVLTVPFTYMNCSAPSAEHIYRFNPTESLDVFPHIAGASMGTIVFIHGGGFTAGDKRGDFNTCAAPNAGLANNNMGAIMKQRETGWDIVSINYRLITSDPGTKFPGPLVDVVEAVKWAQGVGGQWAGINGSKVVVAGHSAGGTLAALMGAYSGQNVLGNQFPSIAGWVAVSAPLNENAGQGAANFNTLVNGNVFGMTIAQASPSNNLTAGDPPGYLIHGVNDPIVGILHSDSILTLSQQRGYSINLDRVTPDRNKAGENNDGNHIAIGGADYNRFAAWLAQR